MKTQDLRIRYDASARYLQLDDSTGAESEEISPVSEP